MKASSGSGEWPRVRMRPCTVRADYAATLFRGKPWSADSAVAEEAHRAKAQPNRRKSAGHAQCRVGQGDRDFTAAKQMDSFVPERGEGGEPAEKTGEKEKARLGRKQIAMLSQRRECADDKTTANVDQESAERETPQSGMMQDQSANLVTGNGADKTTEADNKRLFHRDVHRGIRGIRRAF